ncbi:hypothetical protein F5Y05DRAFT_315710 [Hypoxylon sp. FL0543]|nr:hypothetical protein F5Y05DRAFT_315710 [Hypoxylon sp. FL0543]
MLELLHTSRRFRKVWADGGVVVGMKERCGRERTARPRLGVVVGRLNKLRSLARTGTHRGTHRSISCLRFFFFLSSFVFSLLPLRRGCLSTLMQEHQVPDAQGVMQGRKGKWRWAEFAQVGIGNRTNTYLLSGPQWPSLVVIKEVGSAPKERREER